MIPHTRRLLWLGFTLWVLMTVLATALPAQGNFYLKDGDTVVFYGDSITEQRLYTTFVETFVLTRYPDLKVKFVHSGWGGDRVTGGGGGPIDERLRRDVIAYRPTVVTIMLGMNDGEYRAFDEAIFDRYRKGYEHIIDVLKQALPGVRITLIEPSPYDDVTREPGFPGGYNSVLVRYGQFVRELAQKNGFLSVDMNAPVVAALRKAQELNPAVARTIIQDRIHPSAAGHLLMAECLLKAWGAGPLVSSVEIDAQAVRILKSENTNITALSKEKSWTWRQHDRVLPMPVNMRDPAMPAALRRAAAGVDLALQSSDFLQSMNQETLTVKRLPGGRYLLRIGGVQVGSFGADELDKGINLAAMRTPMSSRAAMVHQLTVKRTDVHQVRWRQVEIPLREDNLVGLPLALESLDNLDAEIALRQRIAAETHPLVYELTPE